MPPLELLKNACRKSIFFEGDVLKSNKLTDGKIIEPTIKRLKEEIKCSEDDFIDFLEKCFVWDPELRMTPNEGLNHPWILNFKMTKTNLLDRKSKRK